MTISYAITVCSEFQELKRLLDPLQRHLRPEDEIVVLQDTKNYTEIEKEIHDYCIALENQKVLRYVNGPFPGDFAVWKNSLNSFCTKDYIFQLDADEFLDGLFLRFLPELLDLNPGVDLFWVPRINTVKGLTEEDIQKWHWRVTKDGWVNWPDYQGRIYRNGLQWAGKVHERIVGAKTFAYLPDDLHLYHPKSIDKQRQQNEFYNKLQQ